MIIQKLTYHAVLSFAVLAVVSLSFAACTDENTTGTLSKGGALSARKISQKEISRSVPPNDFFDTQTQYRFWVYDNEQSETQTDDNRLTAPNVGVESNTHYITFLDPKNDALIKGNIHIYGLTDNTTHQAPECEDTNQRTFSINLDNTKEQGYNDYCRGYLHYDSQAPEYASASYAVVPFRHILSQMTVTVIQQGEVKLEQDQDGNVHREIKERYDIHLKRMRLCNSYTDATYDVSTDNFELDNRMEDRYIWTKEEGMPIPYQEDNEDLSAPKTTVLVLPQAPEAGNAFKLKLRISGKDAGKFINSNNQVETDGDDVILTLPFVDTTETDPTQQTPIAFQSGYHYNLVVVFQGTDVNIVTIRPTIYPFFDGETEEGAQGDRYENQQVGQSHVFDNVEWSDRYTGAAEFRPTDKASFVRATGFYYQKDRTIPFFPSTYVGGMVIDADGVSLGAIGDNGIAQNPNQLKEGEVYYHLYGRWNDVAVDDMWNNPKVKPIVSYYLSPEQALSVNPYEGRDYKQSNKIFDLDRYYRDRFTYNQTLTTWTNKGEGSYCTTVDDFVKSGGGYWKLDPSITHLEQPDWYNPDYLPQPKQFIRYIASMENHPSYTWRDTPNLPCPPGWRLPTINEFYSIMPSSPFAGNICFLNHYGIEEGVVGGDGADIYQEKELYIKLPYRSQEDCNLPVPDGDNSTTDYFQNWNAESKDVFFPGPSESFGDPSPGYETEYVIGIRRFNETEYTALDDETKNNCTPAEYAAYASKVDGLIATSDKASNDGRSIYWGAIYAIKKVGTADAYRMRWHIERIADGGDSYQIVVDKYKSNANEHLLYELKDMHHPHFYMNYDWDHPDATLYFPITGIVGDVKWTEWWPNASGAIYNYGTETILLTSDYVTYRGNLFQATYRIKVAGTGTSCQYLYPAMDRLANGGQVRPVRTYK